MTTLTKNQHYVWCSHLREWTDAKGNIACYMQKERKLFQTRPENIAVERFFYEITELSSLDHDWIENIIKRASSSELQEMHRDTVRIFQYAFKLESWLAEQRHIPAHKRAHLQVELDKIKKMIGERWHTGIENLAKPILDSLKNRDVSFYEALPGRINFIHFISQQFFRTPKLRNLQIREGHPYFDQGLDLDRTWFIESQIYATNVSTGIFLEQQKYKFKFLINEGENEFITGDQPVISLGIDGVDFRMYYPLQPRLALIYEKDEQAPLKIEAQASPFQIEFYNNQIMKFSYNQIYGSQKEYLQAIAALPKDVLAD